MVNGDYMVLIGVWVHPSSLSSKESVEDTVNVASRVPIDKLMVLVKDGNGNLFFRYKDYRPEYDYLKDLTKLAKDQGLEVHAWFVTLREGGETPKGWVARNPQYAVINEMGKPVGWICPSYEKARQRILSLFKELLENYEVEGIHLDYIRYPEPIVARGCFCNQCGKGGYTDEDWVMRGVEHVSILVEESYELVKEYGAELSAAVFPNYPDCIVSVRQDWRRWVDEGLLDWLAPMNYTNIMEVFRIRTMIHASIVPEGILLFEGIGKKSSMSNLSPGRLIRQAEIAVRMGADGIMIFSYASLTKEDLKLLEAFISKY